MKGWFDEALASLGLRGAGAIAVNVRYLEWPASLRATELGRFRPFSHHSETGLKVTGFD
jgi:hypothetical protein